MAAEGGGEKKRGGIEGGGGEKDAGREKPRRRKKIYSGREGDKDLEYEEGGRKRKEMGRATLI